MSTWSVLKTVLQSQMLTDAENSAQTTSDEAYACSLEFDINTSAENTKAISPTRLKSIIPQLADLAIEIAIRGDVR